MPVIYITPSPSFLSLFSSPSAGGFALSGEAGAVGGVWGRVGRAVSCGLGQHEMSKGREPSWGGSASLLELAKRNVDVSKPSWEVGSSILWVLGDAEMGRRRFS